MVVFAILGCLASVAYFLVWDSSMFWMTVILSPLGWACYNVSSVFSNAFLPIYVRAHPDVLEATERVEAQEALKAMDERNKLMNRNTPADEKTHNARTISRVNSGETRLGNVLTASGVTIDDPTLGSVAALRKVEERVSNDLSARCAAAANIGAIVIQGVCAGISLGLGNTLLSLKIAIAFTGAWWLVWTIVVMPWLDARPGPPLPKGENWIVYSWSQSNVQKPYP